MEVFFYSTLVVALAEIGDKTQLLAFFLAARYKKPIPIVFGILIATVLNHVLAGAIGVWITTILNPDLLRWIVGMSFLAMAVWIMIPDKIEATEPDSNSRFGVFGVTVVIFFLAEMGDKTQLATVALAAHYANPVWVIVGTTVGMMLANVPAVYLGEKLAQTVRFTNTLKWIHLTAAAVFAALGVAVLVGWNFL